MTIVGATGHQEIPPPAEADIVAGVNYVLRSQPAGLVAICSLAVGTDQLVAQAVLDIGGALDVVIPCERYDETFNGADLVRFRQLLGRARRIETLRHPAPTEEAFLDAGRRVVDHCELLVAVWDGEAADGLGGTGDVVDYARSVGRKIVIIWPQGVTR